MLSRDNVWGFMTSTDDEGRPPPDLDMGPLEALRNTLAEIEAPRTALGNHGAMTWQCVLCGSFVVEEELLWGAESTLPWRAECRSCRSWRAGTNTQAISDLCRRSQTPSPRSSRSSPRSPPHRLSPLGMSEPLPQCVANCLSQRLAERRAELVAAGNLYPPHEQTSTSRSWTYQRSPRLVPPSVQARPKTSAAFGGSGAAGPPGGFGASEIPSRPSTSALQVPRC
jgi:hypothetical protein